MDNPANSLSFDRGKMYGRTFELGSVDTVTIFQSEVGDVGCVVWDAAIVLAKYLEMRSEMCDASRILENDVRGRSVLELGAGTGYVGIVAACLGANVVITDLPEFVELIQMNIEANEHVIRKVSGGAICSALRWGTAETTIALVTSPVTAPVTSPVTAPDYIILSDCIYYKESLEPLVQTLICASGPSTTVLCCYEERITGDKPMLQQHFFEVCYHCNRHAIRYCDGTKA